MKRRFFRSYATTAVLLCLFAAPLLSQTEPAPSVKKQSWLRPGLQFLAFMGYSQTRYWLKYSQFVEDWQYHFNWHDQSKRWFTLQAWKFDSNAFSINWTHAGAGCIYYNFARTNGLSQKNSFLFTLATSAYWEYLVEWREVISLNDMVFTPVGGYISGEIWYRFSRALQNRFKPAAYLLNPLLFINPSKRLGIEDQGKNWVLQSDLALRSGSEHRSNDFGSRPTQEIALSLKIQDQNHADPFGRFDINARYADDSVSEIGFFIMVPHALRPYATDRPPRLTFNWASAFTFYKRKALADYDSDQYQIHHSPEEMLDIPRNYQDKMAVLHMLGPQLHHHLSAGKLSVLSSFSLFGDFSLCNSLALNEYSRLHDLHPLTSTVFAYGYYYGLGLSAFWENTARLNGFTLNASLAFTQAWSVNALDRFDQDPSLRNPGCRDGLLSYKAALSWSPRSWPLALQIQLEGRSRRGRLDGTRTEESMTLVSAGLAVRI